jgi:hypothetical protein
MLTFTSLGMTLTLTFFFNVTDTGMSGAGFYLSSITYVPFFFGRILAGDWAKHKFLLYHFAAARVVGWHLRSWRLSDGGYEFTIALCDNENAVTSYTTERDWALDPLVQRC